MEIERFSGMQDFDFAQILITFTQVSLKRAQILPTFAQISPKSNQICSNLINFATIKIC